MEVEATVADYLAMLVEYLSGERLNKAAHNRSLRTLLNDRSAAAVEFKHQNISAILVEDGYDYLDGYRPAYNYQDLLRDVVREQLAQRADLKGLLRRAVEAPVLHAAVTGEILPELVRAPRPIARPGARERYERVPVTRTTDFHAREAQNRSLGDAGELSALSFERHRLWTAGKRSLAERVEHVAKTKGDGLGFDILSFETNGRERLVEVKTTRRAEMTPFFITRNEVEVSGRRASEYHLYRLYRFDRDPKLFILSGALDQTCRLEPTAYRAEVA